MRTLHTSELTKAVAEMARETNHFLSEDVTRAISRQAKEEPWPVAKDVLE